MAMKKTFDTAVTAYTDYYSYIRTAVEDLGLQHACKILTTSDTGRGIQAGKAIRAEDTKKKYDAVVTAKIIIDMAKEIGGIDDVLESSPENVVTVTKFGNCPVYEAAKAAGLDDKTIEKLCRAGSIVFFDKMVKQLDPSLSYRLKAFRSQKDGGCVEETVFGSGEKRSVGHAR